MPNGKLRRGAAGRRAGGTEAPSVDRLRRGGWVQFGPGAVVAVALLVTAAIALVVFLLFNGDDDDAASRAELVGNDELDGAEVSVDACGRDNTTGWYAATVDLRNTSSEISDYRVEVEFLSEPEGTELATGNAAAIRVHPDQAQIVEVRSNIEAEDGVEFACRVVEVDRTPSD